MQTRKRPEMRGRSAFYFLFRADSSEASREASKFTFTTADEKAPCFSTIPSPMPPTPPCPHSPRHQT